MKDMKCKILMLISSMTGSTIVNFFGSTYVVSDNVVRKIR